ncbi:MAG: carbohydrate binding domain-containing protein [Promethearchaeota archaeon]
MKKKQSFIILILVYLPLIILFLTIIMPTPIGKIYPVSGEISALIRNGDFEFGNLDPYWATDYAAIATASDSFVHSGTYGCNLSQYSPPNYGPAFISQTFSTPIFVNSTFSITFWRRSDTDTNLRITVVYLDETITTADSQPSTDSWTQQTVTLSVGKYMRSIKFERTTTNANTMGLDDIVFSYTLISEFHADLIPLITLSSSIALFLVFRQNKTRTFSV